MENWRGYNCTPDFPSDFVGFNLLTERNLVDSVMTIEFLRRVLSIFPLLQMYLMHFAGLQRPVISFLNVTDLNLHGCQTEGIDNELP